jgi:RES domain-containing protein
MDRVLTGYRIGDPDGAYPIFDATDSKLFPGRWNTADTPMIYASRYYSTAMLEKLAHGSGRLPKNQHLIETRFRTGSATRSSRRTICRAGNRRIVQSPGPTGRRGSASGDRCC